MLLGVKNIDDAKGIDRPYNSFQGQRITNIDEAQSKIENSKENLYKLGISKKSASSISHHIKDMHKISNLKGCLVKIDYLISSANLYLDEDDPLKYTKADQLEFNSMLKQINKNLPTEFKLPYMPTKQEIPSNPTR